MIDPRYKDLSLSEFVTPRERLLLTRVIEECAEVIQACTKILRFGPDDHHPDDPDEISNLVRLRAELSDLRATLEEFGE